MAIRQGDEVALQAAVTDLRHPSPKRKSGPAPQTPDAAPTTPPDTSPIPFKVDGSPVTSPDPKEEVKSTTPSPRPSYPAPLSLRHLRLGSLSMRGLRVKRNLPPRRLPGISSPPRKLQAY